MKDKLLIPRLFVMSSLLLNSCIPVVAKESHPKGTSKKETVTQTYILTDIHKVLNSEFDPKIPEMDNPLDSKPQVLNFDKYLAHNQAEAVMVAHSIGVEDPSNMCGFLAGQILKDMRIFPQSTNNKEFWTIDPIKQPDRFQKLFPESKFDSFRINVSSNRYDFAKNPLQTGDFLFLTGGKYGFGHMLVVTEIDNLGRAYTVTNILQKDGSFTIEKIMLYDPNIPVDPNASLFYNPANGDEPFLTYGWLIGSPHRRTGINIIGYRPKVKP